MMFCANSAPSSAAVQAPSDCRIGTMSLSIVFGRPTTVRLVAVLVQVGGEVGGRGVGVVAADGVQHVDAVGLELLGGDLQRVLALLRPGRA